MSSIYGRINLNTQPLHLHEFEKASAALGHWNPDNQKIVIEDHVGFGHLMLYNTLASKNEELPFQHDGLTITADARLDNREEICTLLKIKNDEYTYSDGYLILQLYKKFQKDCVKHIIGDFAFAIWDKAEQTLFCARDHMGVKPFFYSLAKNFFAFATEKKGLLCIPELDNTINEEYLYSYVRGSFTQLPDTTLYKHIKRLSAAHTLTLSLETNEVKTERYWEPDVHTEIQFSSTDDYIQGLKHHFEEAVKCRLRSEYKVGAELSGGLDSSGIVGVAHQLIGNNIHTFSNTLDKNISDEKMLKVSERKYIEAVIEHLSLKNSTFITEDIWKNPIEEADFLLKVNDGLEMWNPTWQLGIKQAALHNNVRTMLSGFPGDQMVTDKGKKDFLYHLEKGAYATYWKGLKNKTDIIQRLMPFIPYNLAYVMHKASNLLYKDNGTKLAASMYDIPFKYRWSREDTEWQNKYFKESYNSLRHYQRARLLRSFVELRMEAETRQGIYFRTEPRFPMADIRLTQYYLSLPGHIKCMGNMNRFAYRMAVKEYIPNIIFNRTDKIGNMAPFLYNEHKNKEKKLVIEEILQRVKKKSSLPLSVKKNAENAYNINLLRWLDLL